MRNFGTFIFSAVNGFVIFSDTTSRISGAEVVVVVVVIAGLLKMSKPSQDEQTMLTMNKLAMVFWFFMFANCGQLPYFEIFYKLMKEEEEGKRPTDSFTTLHQYILTPVDVKTFLMRIPSSQQKMLILLQPTR
jgi:chromate transport protein ChrA